MSGTPGFNRFFRAVLIASTAMMAPGGIAVAHAQSTAQAGAASFNIPSQSLTASLTAFARQTGIRIAYPAALTSGKSAPALRGSFTSTEALGQILAGSGLSYRFTGDRAVTIIDPSAAASGAVSTDGSTVLQTIEVEGGAQDPGVGFGGSLASEGYVARASTVGTKTDTELKKVPQSVSAVTRQEMEDRNVQSLVDAVTYKSGVRTGVYGFDPRFDTVHVRGFDVTNLGFYRDGLRDINGRFSVFRKEPYGLESVTVLKGPSSALYGGGSPGGLVNAVSKRPTETPFNEIEAQVGTWDRYQVNFDTSGPVAGNDNILYRLTGIARTADTQFIAAPNDRVYIAPALTFRSDDRDTHLTILGEYSDITTGGAAGYYSNNGKITDYEEGDPAWGDFRQKQWRIGYEFEHNFNENVTFRQNLRYSSVDVDARWVSFVPGLVIPAANVGYRISNQILNKAKVFDIDNHVQLNFDTGAAKHTALLGLDYNHIDSDYGYGIGYGDLHAFDLISQPYGQRPIYGPDSMNSSRYVTRQGQLGVYAQDQIEYDRFVLTLSGRYDWISAKTDTSATLLPTPTPASTFDQKDSQFTGRVGLTYLFDNGISPYVSYSTSFAQEVGLDYFGAPFRPSKGEQYEIGVKYMPDDLNLSVNAAVFNIEQTNMTVNHEVDAYKYVQLGAVRSRGFEIEATTSLAGIDLTAAYTYVDMKITDGNWADPNNTIGNVPSGIPAHQLALWGSYEIRSGFAEGLTLGAGMRFYGKTWGDEKNTIRNDARTLVDAAISYDFGVKTPSLNGLVAQVNVKNIFDNREVTCAVSTCYREEGRNIIGSLRYRF